MKPVNTAIVSIWFVAASAAAYASGHDITNQTYTVGKAGAQSVASANPLADCPADLRGMYRGTLYCRQPLLAVVAPRDGACPEGYYGMYRGDLYCFSGKN